KAQFAMGYRGMINLSRRSGMVAQLEAHVIHANDEFEFAYGDNPHLTHKPAWGRPAGEIIGSYAIATLKEGTKQFEVMDREQIEYIRTHSKAPNSPAWRDWYDEMARKCPIRRLWKYLPSSTDADWRDVMNHAAEVEDGVSGIEIPSQHTVVPDGRKRRSDFSLSRKPEPMPPPEEPDEPDEPSPFDPASEPEEPPEPPKRGRPAGSTNKPKPAPEPVTLQNAEPESESPSVDAQLRDQQWFSSVVAKIKAVASNDELTAVVKAEIPPERLMDFSPYIKPLRSRFAQAERPAEPSGREDLF
ncbi:MAG: recombinase RecT, partial [Pseudomonadota bacterium]